MVASPPRFLWKFVLAFLLALPVGLAWAVWESGHAPSAILERLKAGPPAPKPAPHGPERPAKTPGDTPPARPPDPPPDRPPPPSTDLYTPDAFDALDRKIDLAVFRGRLADAEASLKAIVEPRVPPDRREVLRFRRDRLGQYRALIALTDPGDVVDPPAIREIELKTGIVVYARVLREDAQDLFVEDLKGVRVKYSRQIVRTSNVYPEMLREPMIIDQLRLRADKKKIETRRIVREGFPGFAFLQKAGARPAAMEYFDLADFAASYGLSAAALALFDRAIEIDAGVASAVREIKAQRLAKSFIFHLTNDAKDEARRVLEILRARFGGTEAVRGLADGWVAALYEKTTGSKIEKDVPELAGTVQAPPPVETGTRPAVPSSTNVSDAESAYQKGEDLLLQGKKHFDLSSPDAYPESWERENREAMQCFMQARDEYLRADSIFEARGEPTPQKVTKRITDANMLVVMCRKRAL